MSRNLSQNASSTPPIDRRESPRLGVQVRVSVLGVDDRTTLHNETTETLDVSARGVRLVISYPVYPGSHISLMVDHPDLKAKMAVFMIRWVQPFQGKYMVGGQLISPADKWQIAED
ncbi:MAG TPA: PilZ domain-containing protein [Blastocatellia bacterium]|nr:PilZ domain-containing protein [Blastocatellia bacterium]